MSRSVKKGPYVQEALYKRVVAMNETGEKKVLIHGAALPRFSRNLSATPLRSTTDASTFRFSLPRK